MRELPAARALLALGLLVGTVGLVLLGTGPFAEVSEAFGLPVTMHAGAATGLLLVGACSLPLCWRLFAGTSDALWALRVLATAEAILALLAVAFGNWLFVRSSYGGILQLARPAHQVLFTFKRLIALFPLPLATAAAFVLWAGGSRVVADSQLRILTAVLLALSFFCLVMAFGLGAAVTRLRTV